MFDHFTNTARRAMAIANQETHRLGGNIIGDTELLLGILKQEHSSGAMVLSGLGINFGGVRRQLEQYSRPLSAGSPPSMLPQTLEAKRAIESAINIARELGHNHVETAHMLLGLLRHPELGSSRVLAAHGVSYEPLQQAVVDAFDQDDALAAKGET
jgi:ATP-dependent Clp protease ATP-binding subunit ClpC